MSFRAILFFVSVMVPVVCANAQSQVYSAKSGGEVLRLIRNDKLDLILPGAMRDNNVDMWIHVTRAGDVDPLSQQFGSTSGYLIFTDLGDRIERVAFGRNGAVENIDIRGSTALTRAITGYDFEKVGFSVYDEIAEFVAERDPATIAVNTSVHLSEADGISYSQYLKLEKILGPKYSSRIISAENVITDFLVRRTLREVTAQTNALEIARQIVMDGLARVTPGVTTSGELAWWVREESYRRGLTGYTTDISGYPRIYYSAVNTPDKTVEDAPPDVRFFFRNPDYVLQRGDFFSMGGTGIDYMGFGIDTKIHAYILREGETRVPASLQKTFDLAIAGQWIMREHMKVGMTARESLSAMVAAMEDEGYIYTPFVDSGALTPDGKSTADYAMVQRALARTDKPGFSIDHHSFGNNPSGLSPAGPSVADFRQDMLDLTIQENHLFAYEYMVHMNIPERPGYPLCINISNPQIVSSRGIEFIQPPNEKIVLIN